jgi:hypothetical protein
MADMRPALEQALRALRVARVSALHPDSVSLYAAAITRAETALAQEEQEPVGDSYADLFNALQRIETAAVFLPSFKITHEGGLEAVVQNIVDAIAALEQEEQEPVVVRAEALDLILEAAEVLDKVRVSCDAWEKYGLRDFLPDELTGTAGMLRDGSALTHPPRREWQRDELLEALRLIAATDPVDAALDPQRAVRVARAAIEAALKERNHG